MASGYHITWHRGSAEGPPWRALRLSTIPNDAPATIIHEALHTLGLEQLFADSMLQHAAGDVMDTKAVAELFPGRSKSVRNFTAAQLER